VIDTAVFGNTEPMEGIEKKRPGKIWTHGNYIFNGMLIRIQCAASTL
jgi:hypothetical protein